MHEQQQKNIERVGAWQTSLEQYQTDTPALISFYETVCGIIWKASLGPMSNVMLSAVWERAISSAAGQYPSLDSLIVRHASVEFVRYRAAADGDSIDQVARSFGAVLAEFITISASLNNKLQVDLHYRVLAVCAACVREEMALTIDPERYASLFRALP